MAENLIFANKLAELRREKGFSQEMLADTLNVSRQAVSKWEAGRTLPDVPKLILVAELFGVSLDELLRDTAVSAPPADAPMVVGPLVAARSLRHEYKSKARLFGLPVVHICWGNGWGRPCVAKGIIALGDIAVGGVAVGGIAVGGVALGGLSFGLLLALGGLAVGGIAIGGVAIGLCALGGLAIGVWALGGAAIGGQVAGGAYANARVAVGHTAVGDVAFDKSIPLPAFDTFQNQILNAAPGTARFFIRILYSLLGG